MTPKQRPVALEVTGLRLSKKHHSVPLHWVESVGHVPAPEGIPAYVDHPKDDCTEEQGAKRRTDVVVDKAEKYQKSVHCTLF